VLCCVDREGFDDIERMGRYCGRVGMLEAECGIRKQKKRMVHKMSAGFLASAGICCGNADAWTCIIGSMKEWKYCTFHSSLGDILLK